LKATRHIVSLNRYKQYVHVSYNVYHKTNNNSHATLHSYQCLTYVWHETNKTPCRK